MGWKNNKVFKEEPLRGFIESIVESSIGDTANQFIPSLTWHRGDMPVNLLEKLISYRRDLGTTGPNILSKIYDFDSRVSDVRDRREDYYKDLEGMSDESLDKTSLYTWFEDGGGRIPNTVAVDENIDIRDILAQRNVVKDLLLKQNESTNVFGDDIGGATKESTDDAILGIQRLQHIIERALNK